VLPKLVHDWSLARPITWLPRCLLARCSHFCSLCSLPNISGTEHCIDMRFSPLDSSWLWLHDMHDTVALMCMFFLLSHRANYKALRKCISPSSEFFTAFIQGWEGGDAPLKPSLYPVSEITGLKDHDLDLWRSPDVIDDVIIRSAIGHFLLVGDWYQASISNLFRDICI